MPRRDLKSMLSSVCDAHRGDYRVWEHEGEAQCLLESGAKINVQDKFPLGPRVTITDSNGLRATVDGARHIRMHPLGVSTQIGDEEIRLNEKDEIERITIVGGEYGGHTERYAWYDDWRDWRDAPLHPGARVKVSEGSGLASNKQGVVVDRREVRVDGSGVPINTLYNPYKPVDWDEEVAVRLDDGELITMYKDRLEEL